MAGNSAISRNRSESKSGGIPSILKQTVFFVYKNADFKPTVFLYNKNAEFSYFYFVF